MKEPTDTSFDTIQDSLKQHWVYRILPKNLIPYAQLARWERPIGWQLLMWPAWWSILLSAIIVLRSGADFFVLSIKTVQFLFLFFLGAFVMRGAGCCWNDLVDHKIDSQVERTRLRPLPAGRVTRKNTKIFMLLQCLIGLIILLQMNRYSIFLGSLSIVLIAVYPFAKRITHWPQLVLGCVFNWGALLGWSIYFSRLDFIPLFLYLGAILWTIGYDTIYAQQDKEDDALIGIGSTALLFGRYSFWAIFIFYIGFLFFTSLAFILAQLSLPAFIGLFFVFCHILWQLIRFDPDDGQLCLKIFKSNSFIGLILFLGLLGAYFYP